MELKRFKYLFADREKGIGTVKPVTVIKAGKKIFHYEVICPQTKSLICSFDIELPEEEEKRKRGRPAKSST